MKKKNLRSLALNKKSISSLKHVSGGVAEQTMIGEPCQPPTIFNSCDYCPSSVCESFICPSWWGGQLCPSGDK
ncbi:hypothetical protein [Kordia zhangzhouensis]|uniref:hypothetical protein n=1 Tax=Kordia zhangzhouensis TaxID=1620405 RepID=UPI00062941A7|nr:hypothetical protein [Kordia zhangzhouensis]